MKNQTVKDVLKRSIAATTSPVFLTNDLVVKARGAAYDTVLRALKEFVKDGYLVKVGYGTYVKARKSSISNKVVPVISMPEIGIQVAEKLGKKPQLGRAARAYRDGQTTQMPMANVVSVSGRVNRKISFNNVSVRFER